MKEVLLDRETKAVEDDGDGQEGHEEVEVPGQ
jgi:hypothetical protein